VFETLIVFGSARAAVIRRDASGRLRVATATTAIVAHDGDSWPRFTADRSESRPWAAPTWFPPAG
jgi:hypothetical protein